MRRLLIIAVAAIVCLVPVASASGATARGTATVWRVKMVDGNRFRPATLTIARGDVVKWKNRDDVAHTTTGPNWDSGSLASGETFRKKFRRSGTYQYRCTIHASMTGTITVN